jgi:O-antigen/teichoic acid export membrane protein
MLVAVRLTETDQIKVALISIASLTVFLDSLHLTFYGVLRGYERLNYEAIGVLIGQAITVLCGTLILFLRLPLPYLMFSFVLGSLWSAIYSYLMARKVAATNFTLLFKKDAWIGLLRLAIPFAVAAVFVRVYSSIDMVLLNRIAGNLAAAFYGVPFKFVFAFQFIPIALAAALYPAFSREFSVDKKRTGELFVQAERYLMLVVFPLVAGIVVMAKPLITIFYKDQYLPAVPIMVLLAWCLIPAFLDFPVGALLNAGRRQNVQTALMGIVMVSAIILNLLLIPHYGGMGAATAALTGNSLLFFGGLFFVSRLVLIPWNKLLISLARIGGASLIMAVAVAVIGNRTPLYFSIPFGVLVYLGMLFISREVGKNEVVRLRDLMLKPAADNIENSHLL